MPALARLLFALPLLPVLHLATGCSGHHGLASVASPQPHLQPTPPPSPLEAPSPDGEPAPPPPADDDEPDEGPSDEWQRPRWLSKRPGSMCEELLSRDYAAARKALGAQLASDETVAELLFHLPDLFVCFDDAAGAWAQTIVDLTVLLETPPGYTAPVPRIDGVVKITRFDQARQLTALRTRHHFRVKVRGMTHIRVRADDTDGDGLSELFYELSWIDGGIGNEHDPHVEVFKLRGGKIAPLSLPREVTSFDDIDHDGHLDLIKAGAFYPGPPGLGGPDNEEVAAIPWEAARAMGDGTFREDTPQSVAHLKRQCPEPPAELFTEQNGFGSRYDMGKVAACALHWGVPPAEVSRQAKDKAGYPVDAGFERWLRRPIARHLRLR